jgi:glycosyltransferase involved in cell wall biosynthesis
LKVFVNPSPIGAEQNMGGIWRVIQAEGRWLPEHGIEIVDAEKDADVIHAHAGEVVDSGKPYVTSSHGLYWTGDMEWPAEYWQYNNPCIEALRRAWEIITPSEWVAQPIRRDMRKSPIVIPHGIDGSDYEPIRGHAGYVLWGKPRVDVVSDPRPVNEIARLLPGADFWTTHGRAAENVKVTGVMPRDDFLAVLARASVWLATTRETGDIASREAMALGIPVLGWRWGGTGELVKHLETGYLATPYDYEDTARGLRWLMENRDRVGAAARDDVLRRFQWKDLIGRYASVFRRAQAQENYPVDVTFVVPSYNYAKYLPECLESIKRDEYPFSSEVIVVDDASTDDTQAILSNYDNLTVIRHETNSGLPAALNTGWTAARGEYVVNLDADNVLREGIVDLWQGLQVKPWVDVATGPYRIMNTDRVHGADPDASSQLQHNNQIPSTCMIRRRPVERLGGYRRRQAKNEDAEFWCRAFSAGIRAEKVTDVVTFEYRWHGENKSQTEGGEDDHDGPLSWNFYTPWRVFQDITPFAMTGHPQRGSWAVRSYDRPHVSVVIPCGPGHERYLPDALDSVAGQTFPLIECVVGNDTGKPLDVAAMGHPWVRVVDVGGGKGPAIARNTAIAAAKAPLIVPLDADDLLYPGTIYRYYGAWLEHPDMLVYGDCETEDSPGQRVDYPSGPWSWEKIKGMAIYQDTILYPKQWWEAVGGYPDGQPWEDWLFGALLHIMGVGACYVQKPWGVYRHWTALTVGRSKSDGDNAAFGSPEWKERVQRARDWIDRKEIEMACRGCGGKGKTATEGYDLAAKAAEVSGEDVLVLYEGPGEGAISVNSLAVPGRKYRFSKGEIKSVPAGDWVHRFSRLVGFRQAQPAQSTALPELPQAPIQPPHVIPQPDGIDAPQVATEPSIDTLGLSGVVTEKLRAAGFASVIDIQADVRMTGGQDILAIDGIGQKTYERIAEAVSA